VDDHQSTDSPLRQRGKRLVSSASTRAVAGLGRTAGWTAGWTTRLLGNRPRWQRYLLAGLFGMAVLALLLFIYLLVLIPLTPGIDDLKQARAARASVIMSADGKELASFDLGVQERVKLAQISPHVIAALIATEDRRFYDHHGVDFKRLGGAMFASLKGDAQGGSTITQQLARNMFPEEIGRSRNVNRKLKELVTALKIEVTFSKTEILEAYLNTVPFLYNAFGIEMAARTYFDKPAANLDVLESATLVGMLKGTNYYNPVTNPERSLVRRNVVLGQMFKQGAFPEARYRQLLKRPLRVHFARQPERAGTDTHFTAYVRKFLIDWADENDYNLRLDGLVVQTTLDYDLQQDALKAVERQTNALQAVADVEWGQASPMMSSSIGAYAGMHGAVKPFDYLWRSRPDLLNAFIRESAEYRKAAAAKNADAGELLKRFKGDRDFMAALRASKTRLEAGFVAIDPNTGEVKAWVGSRNFQREQFDHVSQAARQPGSTFKPIVYGAALEKGIAPEHQYIDAVTNIKAGDGTVWRPTDMGGSSGRMVTMREGLAFSKNTITAQVMQDVGIKPIVQLAQSLGIKQSKLEAVPSLALGTSPVTLLEMVTAYSTIAAQGAYRQPVFVKRILDRDGKVLATFGTEQPARGMSTQSAITLVDMLRGVINRGTGTAVRYKFGINGDVAGKTGTTQNNADGWFILMHPNLVGGAWVGFNDTRIAMRSSYWGQGGHNALLLVGDFFKAALDARKIDPAALFAGGPPKAPVIRREAPVEEETEEAGDVPQEGMESNDHPLAQPPEEPVEEDAGPRYLPPPPPAQPEEGQF
jgi:penicillin-binding protein 1A